MKSPRKTVLAALAAAAAVTCALATTMTIEFKDGTAVRFDTSKIASVTYSDTNQAVTHRYLLEESFQSGLGQTWEPFGVVGGDFNRFGRVAPGRLEVDVPAGNHWTKTGIMSRLPLFTVAPGMEAAPLRIELTFDASKTTGYVIGLTEVKDADMWRQQNVWFHFGLSSAVWLSRQHPEQRRIVRAVEGTGGGTGDCDVDHHARNGAPGNIDRHEVRGTVLLAQGRHARLFLPLQPSPG